jgi:MFS family permease
MLQGYNTTLSAILLLDPNFLAKFNPKNENPLFNIKFILIIPFGIILGALLSSTLADRLGRRTVLQYASFLGIILIIWSSTAESAADIFTSRSLVGWIIGIGMSVGPVYSAEMASSAERGQVVGFLGLSTIIGSIFAGLCYYTTRRKLTNHFLLIMSMFITCHYCCRLASMHVVSLCLLDRQCNLTILHFPTRIASMAACAENSIR